MLIKLTQEVHETAVYDILHSEQTYIVSIKALHEHNDSRYHNVTAAALLCYIYE